MVRTIIGLPGLILLGLIVILLLTWLIVAMEEHNDGPASLRGIGSKSPVSTDPKLHTHIPAPRRWPAF
jgi:hypothetical protein